MKKQIAIVAVMGASLLVNMTARAADQATLPSDATHAASPTPLLDKAFEEERMRQLGIEPGTRKAELFAEWVGKARQDPYFQRYVLSHAGSGMSQVFGEQMMVSGIARVSSADRARYFALVGQIFDERAPKDCYGEVRPDAVMRKLVVFGNMTDAEAAEYLEITYRAMLAAAHDDAVVVPAPADVQAANVDFGRVLENDVKGDEANVRRLAGVLADSPQATVADRCWALGLVMHAWNAVPEKSREALQSQGTARAYAKTLAAQPAPVPPAPKGSTAPTNSKAAGAQHL